MLTKSQKDVWVQHYLERVPQVEIARARGRSPESVCRMLARANSVMKPLMAACQQAGGDLDAVRQMIRKMLVQ